MSIIKTFAALALVTLAVAAAPAAGNAPAALACGDVVTQSVTLTASLTGCETGLIIGADNVTVDLNGHSIEGLGGGAGILDQARELGCQDGDCPYDPPHDSVTVENGTIRGFTDAVHFNGATHVRVSGLTIEGGSISIRKPEEKVVDITIVHNSVAGGGIGCSGTEETQVGQASISSNVVDGGAIGLALCSADLVHNVVSHSPGDGVFRLYSHGLVARNVANDNALDGIRSLSSHGLFIGNVTNHNGGNGLWIFDENPDHGQFHTLTGNLANANGGYGIFAQMATDLTPVVDGGRNRAHANGQFVQCVGVACNAHG